MRIFQKGFNWSQDGEGNRLVFHLQGCNMRCPWCANPEGLRPEGVLVADEEWLLDSICPHGAIRTPEVDRTLCEGCHARECITEHDTKGMVLSCFEMTTDEVAQEALNNELMFYAGGGVTFTGGEATLQFEELKTVLTELHAKGINTCIETNGTHPRLPELFPLLDQLIMDCKHTDPEKHLRYTGMPIEPVLRNLRRAAAEHPRLHIRVPLIGGVNASEEELEGFVALFSELKGDNVTFEALLYHEYGKRKWKRCGWEYTMTETAHVEQEVRLRLIEKLRAAGAEYHNT